jgi:hypothetical protein
MAMAGRAEGWQLNLHLRMLLTFHSGCVYVTAVALIKKQLHALHLDVSGATPATHC